MIFPCVATHYHPLVYQRAQRRLGVDPDVPLDKRKKIVYFTRLVHYAPACVRVWCSAWGVVCAVAHVRGNLTRGNRGEC